MVQCLQTSPEGLHLNAQRIHFFWLNTGGPVGMSLGMSLLASEVLAGGHHAKITHLCPGLGKPLTPETVQAEISAFPADVYGLGFVSTEYQAAEKLIGWLREWRPEAFLLAGGIHVTVDPESVARIPGVDAVCPGEADGLLVAFLDRLGKGEPWQDLPQFWSPNGEGWRKNPSSALPGLTRQALPAYDLIDYPELIRRKRGFVEVLASRGCPFACAFCQNPAIMSFYKESLEGYRAPDYLRVRGVENFLSELREFVRRYREEIKAFVFGDDTFLLSREWLREFAEVYPKEIGLPFLAAAIAFQIDPETAQLLGRAGCNVLRIGVESGSERLRRKILRKGTTDTQIAESCRLLHEQGINVQGFGMMAVPEETPEDLYRQFELAAQWRMDVYRAVTFVPLPGTRLYLDGVREGLFPETPSYVLDWTAAPSILPHAPEFRLLHRKASRLFPWLMNLHLPGRVARLYGTAWREVEAWEEREFERREAELGPWTLELQAEARRLGEDHYFFPFPDRPDYAFLFWPDRPRKLINVDDQPVGGEMNHRGTVAQRIA